MSKINRRTAAKLICVAATLAAVTMLLDTYASAGADRYDAAQSGRGTIVYQWGDYLISRDASPVPVGGVPANVSALAAGNGFDLALAADGTVWAWGQGFKWALGGHSTANHPRTAVKVEVPSKVAIVAIGESEGTGVAVTSSGSVYGWGYNNGGQLCLGKTKSVRSPELLPLSDIVAAAGGGGHMMYLTRSGSLLMCGYGKGGQLGDGKFASSATPVDVTGLPDSAITAISGGSGTSAVLLADGQVWDWGKNTWGQLGNGTRTDSDVPVQVELPGPAKEVYAGGGFWSNGDSLALLTSGQVYGWGNDADGQLGDGGHASAVRIPLRATALPSGETWTAVATASLDSYALDDNGNLWAWGDAVDGTLGNGHRSGTYAPVKVLSGVSQISATADGAIALAS